MADTRCALCGESFDSPEELDRHVAVRHIGAVASDKTRSDADEGSGGDPGEDLRAAERELSGSHGDQRAVDSVETGAGGVAAGPGDIGPGGRSDATPEETGRAGSIGSGPESGSTRRAQMRAGFGADDVGAVDPEIDFGTTLDVADADEIEDLPPGRIETVPRLPDSGYYECADCGKRFPVYGDYVRHLEKAHGREAA